MELKPEYIFLVAVTVAIAYFLLGRRSTTPKQKSFRCARCSTIAQHTPRTINARRDGKSKFFCNTCHGEWVRSHPQPQPRSAAPPGSRSGGSRSGCLGVLACLLFVPLALVLWWL